MGRLGMSSRSGHLGRKRKQMGTSLKRTGSLLGRRSSRSVHQGRMRTQMGTSLKRMDTLLGSQSLRSVRLGRKKKLRGTSLRTMGRLERSWRLVPRESLSLGLGSTVRTSPSMPDPLPKCKNPECKHPRQCFRRDQILRSRHWKRSKSSSSQGARRWLAQRRMRCMLQMQRLQGRE